MAGKDKRAIRRRKADFNKRFSMLTAQEADGITVSIKDKHTKKVIDTRLVHTMKEALLILENAEQSKQNIFATITSLSGDVRVSIASSEKFNTSFFEMSQTSNDASDETTASSNAEQIDSLTTNAHNPKSQPDIITLNSDDEDNIPTTSKPDNGNSQNELHHHLDQSHVETVAHASVSQVASSSNVESPILKSPITPPIAIRKAKRSKTLQNKIHTANIPPVKSTQRPKTKKLCKEKISELLQLIKNNQDVAISPVPSQEHDEILAENSQQSQNTYNQEVNTVPIANIAVNTDPMLLHESLPPVVAEISNAVMDGKKENDSLPPVVAHIPNAVAAKNKQISSLPPVIANTPENEPTVAIQNNTNEALVNNSTQSPTETINNPAVTDESPDAALDAANESIYEIAASDSDNDSVEANNDISTHGNTTQNNRSDSETEVAPMNQTSIGSPHNTQLQDIINHPENYEVVSVIDEEDEDTDRNLAPEVMQTHRNGDTLWLIYPFIGALKCTERRCNFASTQKEWYKRLSGLTSHLKKSHDIVCKYTEKWCSRCNSSITHLYHTSRHPCLAGIPVSTPREELNEDMPFKCNRCSEFGAYNRHALATHIRKHEADEARERYRQRTQSADPRVPQNTNTNNESQAEQSEDEPSENEETIMNNDENNAPEGMDEDNENADNAGTNEDNINETNIPNPDEPPPSHKFIMRLKNIVHNYSNDKWFEFEALVDEITEDAKDHVKIPKDLPSTFNLKVTDTNDPTAMQRLYRRNRRRAMRLIQGERTKPCNVPIDNIKEKFYSSRENTPDLSVYDDVKKAARPIPMNGFAKSEVKRKLMQCENTAAGPDRLMYNHWRSYDEDASALTLMYNICLKAKNIPQVWKRSKTVMIPKSGDLNSACNWRPIALSSTAYKLFSALMARRMSRWMEKHQLLAKGQKGYRKFDGAIENIYTLESRIADAKMRKKSFYIFLLDLQDAFGSISHDAIYDVLEKSGAGKNFIDLKKNMNEGAVTQILTPNGLSDDIPLIDGVKQGDPMSGNEFNLSANPIFDAIQDGREELYGLGFADDTSAFANSPDELQNTINRIVHAVNKLGLKLNINKCRIIQFHPKRSNENNTFHINDQEIPALKEFYPTQYLGKPIGFNLFEDKDNIDEYIQSGIRILESKLAPWQKLDAMKTFFFPSLAYAMRTMLHTKQSWRNLDETLKPLFKKLLGLPVYAASDYLYGGSDDGLIGIPCAAWDSDVARVDTAFKLLMSEDPEIKSLAFDDLSRATQARCSRIPNNVDLQEFLSNRDYRTTESRHASLWSKARSASGRLGIKWHIADDHKITLLIDDKAITDKRKIFRTLRTVFKDERTNSFKQLRAQGRTQECFGANKVSNHFLRTGDFLRFCDWNFIHRARLAVVKLNGHIPTLKGSQRRCRFCGFKVESIAHVLNSCDRFLATKITDRHDKIVKRLKKASSEKWDVLKENQPYGTNRRLRPDLILVNKESEALVIDVTMPFEAGLRSFNKARQTKIEKYKPVVEELKLKYKKVSCEAVIVGPLGSWDNANDKVVSKLCTNKYAALMKRLIISDTIRASRDMYVEHTTEQEQFDYRSRFNISKRSIYPRQLQIIEENDNTNNRTNADELSQQLSDNQIDELFSQNPPNITESASQRTDAYVNHLLEQALHNNIQVQQPILNVDIIQGSPPPNQANNATAILDPNHENVDNFERSPQPNIHPMQQDSITNGTSSDDK